MKKSLTYLLFLVSSFVSYAREEKDSNKKESLPVSSVVFTSGPRVNATNYADNSTIYIPCGVQTMTIEAWRGGGLADVVGNFTHPAGWYNWNYCGPSGLSNAIHCVTLDASSGGTVNFRFSDVNRQNAGEATFTISRTPIDLVIVGPSVLCSSATYDMTGSFSGGITWTSSNPSILSINSSSGAATKVGTGLVTLTATITTSCGPISTTRSVYCGNPTAPTSMIVRMGPSNNQLCTNATTGIAIGNSNHTSQGISQYNWSFGGWGSYFTGYDLGLNMTSIAVFNLNNSSPSSQTLYTSATNSCGTSPLFSQTFSRISCGSFRVAYPNPVSDILTLSFENSNEQIPDEISLYSETSGKKVYSIGSAELQSIINKKNSLEISVKNYPRGNYFLNINSNGKADKSSILLQ